MTTRQLRLLRAAAVSSVATLLAAVSHTLGGGTAPHPLLILAVAVLFLPLSALLVGLRRSRTRVAAAVLASQGAFHVVFQVLGAPTATTGAAVGAHTHHFELPVLAPGSVAPPLDAPMLLAHLTAAALTTMLLWHAESAVRMVATWFQALLRQAALVAAPSHPRPASPRVLLFSGLDRAIAVAVSRRGPPLLLRD